MKKAIFTTVLAPIVLIIIELQSFSFAHLSAKYGAVHIFNPELFASLSSADVEKNFPKDPLLGWPDSNAPRTVAAGRICGYAFGDSFTYGGEVGDQETWPFFLSRELACEVLNYGVSGYGVDQSVLRHGLINPKNEFVILGLFTEMLRRDVAASWTFYGTSGPPKFLQIKPYFTPVGDKDLLLHRIPDDLRQETIAAHHAGDYYMQRVWTPAHFPYTLQALKAIYGRVVKPEEYRL